MSNLAPDLRLFGYDLDFFPNSQQDPGTRSKPSPDQSYMDILHTPLSEYITEEQYHVRQTPESLLKDWPPALHSNTGHVHCDQQPRHQKDEMQGPSAAAGSWLQNLVRINGDLFAYPALGNSANKSTLHEVGCGSVIGPRDQAQILLGLAAQLLMLVEELGGWVNSSDKCQSRVLHESSDPATLITATLLDQSNSLLLSSTYMKLLDRFDHQLRYIETGDACAPDPSKSRLARSRLHRAELSTTQDFTHVNIISFYTRRIGRALKPLVRSESFPSIDGATCGGPCPRSHTTMQVGKRGSFVQRTPKVLPFEIVEKQSALLKFAEDIQAYLLGLA
ncbi:hypothetical protein AC578_8925 [Pseudocercospora eumusae]|uniref:Uncharacterized protein n=1 Tax=Pseudocercospora eumusae TaxID=321146 RepID=A0A139HMY1_9PEZI|nr:hypothetical protein AC578_8925 [Pseudocercospora eumusae]